MSEPDKLKRLEVLKKASKAAETLFKATKPRTLIPATKVIVDRKKENSRNACRLSKTKLRRPVDDA
jgi:hypothetical protein